MDIDKKIIGILKSKYWKQGWLAGDQRCISDDDLNYLYSKGLSFKVASKSHDELVREIKEFSSRISIRDCYSLLSRSISTRNLPDRSFLSSVLQAKQMPLHEHTLEGRCQICGLEKENSIDLEVMLFEKIMWGGVRLTKLEYIWLDLHLYLTNKHTIVESLDLKLALADYDKIDELSASKFSQLLKTIKGNKAEREILCGILSICDILQHPDHAGFLDSFVNWSEREEPNQHFLDLEWPYCWYNSKYGINFASVEKIANNLS